MLPFSFIPFIALQWSLIHNHLHLYCYGNEFYATRIYLYIHVSPLLYPVIRAKLIILTMSILNLDGILVNSVYKLW